MINFLKDIYHYLLAWAGNIIYGFPSKKLFVIGVTGTKGKTTTVELINAVLEAAGKKTAIISSLRFKVGKENWKNTTSMTMPGRFFIQRLLKKAVKAGCGYAIVEVTSQGILQHRHRFIDWDAAMILNLHPEHIEAHGSFENYRDAKLKFFNDIIRCSKKPRKTFFINEEDRYKNYFINAINNSGEIRYFSRDSFIKNQLNNGRVSIGDWLASNFNLENAAAASAFTESQGIGWSVIKKAFQNFKGVPGRMEIISVSVKTSADAKALADRSAGNQEKFRLVIDYAHTPDSLEKVYQAVGNSKISPYGGSPEGKQNPKSKSRLICVLGAAGGGRDKWKRAVMGKIAAENCDVVILTNEDPYDEDPLRILNDIERGFAHALNSKLKMAGHFKVLDRREAIKKSIEMAKKGDTVVITGKGSESWLHIERGKKIAWDERKIVEELLNDPVRR